MEERADEATLAASATTAAASAEVVADHGVYVSMVFVMWAAFIALTIYFLYLFCCVKAML